MTALFCFAGNVAGIFCKTERRFMSEGVLFYAEQDVQNKCIDPGVGKLSGFQKIAEGTPGSKIISLIDDPVGEVFADIKVIGQRGSTLTEQSIL